MKNFKKSIALLVAVSMIVGCVIGGALAWLTATSGPVENTFTTSDIEVTLTETDRTYKMIPGWTIDKDPKVTVKAGSEDCYLFVKIEKSNNFDSFMTFSVANDWQAVVGESNVYYKIFDSKDTNNTNAKGTPYSVLKDDQVKVKNEVTKEMMNGLTADNYPTLKFTAYASQLYKNNTATFTAAEAWANAQPSSSGTTE